MLSVRLRGSWTGRDSCKPYCWVTRTGCRLRQAEHRKPENVAIDLSVTAAAILLAFGALLRNSIPLSIRRIMDALFAKSMLRLRLLHSGIYTDYIAYLMFGIAAYGVWLVAGTGIR